MPNKERAPGWLGDLSGAFADLGTFLPLVIGMLAVGGFDATGMLTGFGLFALLTAAFYRLPIPVQPMKAIAALVIVGALTPGETAAAGLLIGVVLLVLAATGAIDWLVRVVPVSVIIGVQAAVGVHLVILGAGHVLDMPWHGGAALAALALLFFTPLRNFAAILVVGGAVAVTLTLAPGPVELAPLALHWPSPSLPVFADFERAAVTAVLPQLALTLSNAILVTAALAAEYFPERRANAGARRLAVGTGLFNILAAPLGGVPMCHGAGGLVAQYGFGARTWRAPVIFGLACLVLGIGFGGDAPAVLGLVSLGAIGALLMFAGGEMALTRRLFAIKPSCRLVVLVTVAACLGVNMGVGLAVGLVCEWLRTVLAGERGPVADGR